MGIIIKNAVFAGLFSLFFLGMTSFLHFSDVKTNENECSKINNQPNNFNKFFPDSHFASLVAERLNKKITDNVTINELASIKGYFVVGPGLVSDLTGIGYLTSLDSFDCSKNEVTVIPPEIGKLKNLVLLDLCKAFSLETVPPQIGELKKLKKIRLSLTRVSLIPKEIGNLSRLETLWICCNKLTEIPKEIGNLKKLRELDIHSNNITELPDEICNLPSLISLDISHCGIKQLPENIGNLNKLKSLNLFKNDLKTLPKSIIYLDNLEELNVYDNFKLSESYKRYLPKLLKNKKKEISKN